MIEILFTFWKPLGNNIPLLPLSEINSCMSSFDNVNFLLPEKIIKELDVEIISANSKNSSLFNRKLLGILIILLPLPLLNTGNCFKGNNNKRPLLVMLIAYSLSISIIFFA